MFDHSPRALISQLQSSLAKLGDMSRATLLRVTCPLDVFQFSRLGNFVGNFVARAKFVARETQMFLGDYRKFLVSATLGTLSLLFICMFSHLRKHAKYNVVRDILV